MHTSTANYFYYLAKIFLLRKVFYYYKKYFIQGWATGEDIGSVENALTKDYLSADVWVLPASYIAIVRHQHGVIDAVKVFKFNKPHESLSIRLAGYLSYNLWFCVCLFVGHGPY